MTPCIPAEAVEELERYEALPRYVCPACFRVTAFPRISRSGYLGCPHGCMFQGEPVMVFNMAEVPPECILEVLEEVVS